MFLRKSVLSGLTLASTLVSGVAGAASQTPFLIGSASLSTEGSTLTIHLDRACDQGDMIQVVAASVGAGGQKITASDSGGVNIYQAGGGVWRRGGSVSGSFLATTSPEEPSNAGLKPPATITVRYSNSRTWKAAIAECVPGLELKSGAADNVAGMSPTGGDGRKITLQPSSKLLKSDEPLFVATILVGDASDRWRESKGYTTLQTLQDHNNTLTLAYQIIPGKLPTPYRAFNSAARLWSASNRSYKP
jgi:hypothetical protein